jgi:hypothetical protein
VGDILKSQDGMIAVMKYDYKKDLNTFIDNIENKNIKNNSVIVGKINSNIQSFLKQEGIKLHTRDVVLEVGSFFHILNKVKQDTQLPKELIRSFDETIQTPKRVFFDTVQKHINLIYVDSHDGRLYKVVVQPNYYVKKDIYTNEIVSAGYIEERNLRDLNYIEIADPSSE